MRILLLLILMSACVCDAPQIADADSPPVDAGVARDAAVIADAVIADVAPPPVEDRALAICLPLRRGIAQSQRPILTPRCQASATNGDVGSGDIELPVGACTNADPIYRALVSSIEDQRVDVDIDAAGACQAAARTARAAHPTIGALDDLRAALETVRSAPPCSTMITPLQGERDLCAQAYECADGRRCEADPLDGDLRCLDPAPEGGRCDQSPRAGEAALRSCVPTTACVLGFCTRRLSLGLACTPDGIPCAQGLACSEDGVCADLGAVGTPCSQREQCQSDLLCRQGQCADDPALAAGDICGGARQRCQDACFVCRPDDTGVVRCQDRGAAGDTCAATDQCAEGLFCQSGHCAPLHALAEPCQTNTCAAPGFCAPSGECQTPAGLGESCVVKPCADALACVGGTCHAGGSGDPCNGDNDCSGAHLCVDGTCTLAPRQNGSCTSDGRCGQDLQCVDQRCLAPPTSGPCLFGACDPAAYCDADDQCQSDLVTGAACTDDDMCRSGRCTDTGSCASAAASCLGDQGTMLQLFALGFVFAFCRRRALARLRSR